MTQILRPQDWFRFVTGLGEQEWDYQPLQKLEHDIDLNDMGQFLVLSIGDLFSACKNLDHRDEGQIHPLQPNISPPRLQIKVRKQYGHTEEFDTSALQVRAQPGTMFQVASNFNCLELSSALVNPFSGHYLTHLMSDSTQGPSASAGAGLGAILRLVRHKQREINLLEETPFQPINGKLVGCKLPIFDINRVKVGLHIDVKANFDRSEMQQCVWHSLGPSIDQVYVSTAILGSSPSLQQIECAQTLLYQAYVGTYLCAIYRRSPRLVLTLVGGGAFNNPKNIIVNAIANAHKKLGCYLPVGCQVELPIYETDSTEIVKHFKSKLPNLIEIHHR
jgi:hypothetical protein